MAVMAGVESAVQIHIDRGDDLNARDASGRTPLMLCAVRDQPAICKRLVSAGADLSLRDQSGKTALEIALDAGSHATAAILKAAVAAAAASLPTEHKAAPDWDPASDVLVGPIPIPIAEPTALGDHDSHAAPARLGSPPELAVREPAQPSEAVATEIGDEEFDLSGWESEEEMTRPEADQAVVDSASAVQITITAHQPIDSSAEWDDIDAYLPELALPLARADDAEGRAKLRLLLLRALREGSVPALDVKAQSANEDRSANPEAEAYLAMVINDLGAEVDERLEFASADESFHVFVDPEESPAEDVALDEALAAIDRAASPRHEPLRIFQREFQRIRLLTAEEEVQLAKDMEAALELALDALASWPYGIARILDAGAGAITGSRPLSSIWVGGEPDPEPASAEGLEAGDSATEDSEDAAADDGEPRSSGPADAEAAGFADALRRLAALTEADDARRASPQKIRQALAGLRLNRRFLLELIDATNGAAACPAFARAMADFRKPRDRMTAANLKLAFFHAKKYLYSGEPLDDLAQEGNIGLLKAVDRYDWRRGFRFSTYATWWVRQQISRYVADKARTIRVPVHIFEKLQRAERIAQAFETTNGREPTLAELAGRVDMPSDRLAALMRIAPEPSAIDEDGVDGKIAIDARDDYASPDPADVVGEIQLNRAVDRFISGLSIKDRKEERILRMRFGIGVDEALTLDEIGSRFEVTRERIRQIEAKAIRKLQHPSRSEPFGRQALGLRAGRTPLTQAAQKLSEEGEAASTDSIPQTERPKVQVSPALTRKDGDAAAASRTSALDQLLAKAAGLGIRVDDERQSSGRIWVELVEASDSSHRWLARKLLESGFVFWPGRGYWL